MPRFGQCQDCEHWNLGEEEHGYGVCKTVDSYTDDDLRYGRTGQGEEKPPAFITMCVDGREESPQYLYTGPDFGCASFIPGTGQ